MNIIFLKNWNKYFWIDFVHVGLFHETEKSYDFVVSFSVKSAPGLIKMALIMFYELYSSISFVYFIYVSSVY